MTKLLYHYNNFTTWGEVEIIFDDNRLPAKEKLESTMFKLPFELATIAEKYNVDSMILCSIPDRLKEKINVKMSNYSNRKIEVQFI